MLTLEQINSAAQLYGAGLIHGAVLMAVVIGASSLVRGIREAFSNRGRDKSPRPEFLSDN